MVQSPRPTLLAAGLAVAAGSLLLAGGCDERSRTEPAAGSAAPSAAASASAPAPEPSAASAPAERGSDDIKPVYPVDAGAPDPLAQRFCDAIHSLPARRTAECCGAATPGAEAIAQQCVRTLTFALGQHAVTLAPEDVDRCVAAVTRATGGCDWVTPINAPLPPACFGVVKGALAEKAQCRSSLECGEGMRCQGLSTVDFGACGPPKAARAGCNLAVDMLVTFTRQDGFERQHPECQGYCARGRCADVIPAGGECKADFMCGTGRCVDGKCSAAPLPAAGEACSGGACAYGARCVKGKCAAPRAEGEVCEADAECRGACDRGDGGATGKCQKTCLSYTWPILPSRPLGSPPIGKPPPRRR